MDSKKVNFASWFKLSLIKAIQKQTNTRQPESTLSPEHQTVVHAGAAKHGRHYCTATACRTRDQRRPIANPEENHDEAELRGGPDLLDVSCSQ